MSSEYKPQSGNGNPFDQFSSFMQPTPDTFTRMMQPMLAAGASMIEMNAKMWHAAADASREWCDFVGRRLEKDAKFLHDLRNAETPQSFMDNCAQFSRGMVKDYQEEFSELSRLSSKAAGGASEVVREATRNVGSLSGEGARV